MKPLQWMNSVEMETAVAFLEVCSYMRVILTFFLLSLSVMAEPLVDEFTKQEIPASGNGVPKVMLTGSQIKNI